MLHIRRTGVIGMLNKEKYAEEIVELAVKNEIIALKDNKPINCRKIKCNDCRLNTNRGCSKDIFTEWANSEYKEQILDEVEKAYLSAVINPFRDKVKYMLKNSLNEEFISIVLEDKERREYFNFPYFKKGTMYKGMEINKRYTLEELGLDND